VEIKVTFSCKNICLQALSFITTVSAALLSQHSKALNQAKNGTNIPKMRVFYEHFCRNDCSNSFFTTQNSLLLLSEFSGNDRTCFFFFLSPTSFFFFRKKRKEIGI